MSSFRRMEIDPYLSSCTKLNSRLIKGLNIKTDTLNLKEEIMGNCLEHIGTGYKYLNRTPIAQTLNQQLINETS